MPKFASAIKELVKGRPKLRNQLVKVRDVWNRLRYLYLVSGKKEGRDAAGASMPALLKFTRGSCSISAEMKATFREYTGDVSYEGMPISLESACFFWSLCEAMEPRRILDMGSGFSSFVFRRYQREARSRPEVWSVDESPEWLEKTREFLRAQGLSENHLYSWDEFQRLEPRQFDLISHDLGLMHERPDILERMLKLRTDNGVVVVDDLQNPVYRKEITERLRRYDALENHSLRWLTLDKHLRYTMLVLEKPAV